MSNHVDRKSINFAVFSAFLDQLQSTSDPDLPAVFTREQVQRVLRRAVLTVAVQRLNDEWFRIAERAGRRPDHLLQLDIDDTLFVTSRQRERDLTAEERAALVAYFERLVRGMPALQGSFQ